jgi:hypothetical protein
MQRELTKRYVGRREGASFGRSRAGRLHQTRTRDAWQRGFKNRVLAAWMVGLTVVMRHLAVYSE